MKKLAVLGCLLMLTGFGLGFGSKHVDGEWAGWMKQWWKNSPNRPTAQLMNH